MITTSPNITSSSSDRASTSDSAVMAAPSEIEHFYARKARPERQRDVLFGAGCGLLCFGLFPCTANGSGSDSGDGMDADANDFDVATRALSLAFSLVGLLCVTLSCVVVARARVRTIVLIVLAPLLVLTATSFTTIANYYTLADVVSALDTDELSTQQEAQLGRRVNALFCRAHARDVSGDGDSTSADEAFAFSKWMRASDRASGRRSLCAQDALPIAASSAHAAPLCNLCSRLSGDNSTDDAEMELDARSWIARPSNAAMQWCGAYLVSNDLDVQLTDNSPYYQHRDEVLEHLLVLLARRQASVKLLLVLDWFALPALLALVWWWHSPSAKIQAIGIYGHSVHMVV